MTTRGALRVRLLAVFLVRFFMQAMVRRRGETVYSLLSPSGVW